MIHEDIYSPGVTSEDFIEDFIIYPYSETMQQAWLEYHEADDSLFTKAEERYRHIQLRAYL